MIANSLAYRHIVNAVRDTLIRYESVFAAVPAQIDGARFCRNLLAQIDEALGGALEEPVTLEKAAEASGYSTDHLRRLIRERHLVSYRMDGERKHRVLLSEVPHRARGARSAQADTHAEAPVQEGSAAATTLPFGGDAAYQSPPTLAPTPVPSYDPIADARSVLARVRGAKD